MDNFSPLLLPDRSRYMEALSCLAPDLHRTLVDHLRTCEGFALPLSTQRRYWEAIAFEECQAYLASRRWTWMRPIVRVGELACVRVMIPGPAVETTLYHATPILHFHDGEGLTPFVQMLDAIVHLLQKLEDHHESNPHKN